MKRPSQLTLHPAVVTMNLRVARPATATDLWSDRHACDLLLDSRLADPAPGCAAGRGAAAAHGHAPRLRRPSAEAPTRRRRRGGAGRRPESASGDAPDPDCPRGRAERPRQGRARLPGVAEGVGGAV